MNAVLRDRTSDDIETLHARIDDLAREVAALKRLLTPDHLSGLVSGHMTAHLNSLPQANGYEIAGAVRDLVAALSRPVHRNSTINLPSGPVHMNVVETR
jgi:hypothetical protein